MNGTWYFAPVSALLAFPLKQRTYLNAVCDCRGTLIDGLGGDPVKSSVVVIESGRIIAAGSEANIAIPSGALRLDASGRTILPGFIDCHVHGTYRARDMRQHLLNTPTYNVLRSIDIFRETLACGITTARDMGGADAGFRAAIEEGLIDGPRLLISLGMISQTGGHGDYWVPADMRIKKRAVATRYGCRRRRGHPPPGSRTADARRGLHQDLRDRRHHLGHR